MAVITKFDTILQTPSYTSFGLSNKNVDVNIDVWNAGVLDAESTVDFELDNGNDKMGFTITLAMLKEIVDKAESNQKGAK